MAEIQLPAVADPAAAAVVLRSSLPVPAMVANAGANASRRHRQLKPSGTLILKF
jgi:hypothetical protein